MNENNPPIDAEGIASLLRLGIDPDTRMGQFPKHPALAATVQDGYRVLTALGMGGFGEVWRAIDLRTRRDVAIKCARLDKNPDDHASGFALARLKAEAQLLTRLHTPGIVSLQRTGGSDETLYLVLEFIDGDPIDEFCQSADLDLNARLDLITTLIQTVATLHDAGIVHGDIKPGNILMRDLDTPVLVDFGMAVDYRSNQRNLHPPTYIGGTPPFLAPELEDRKTANLLPTADVFALCMIGSMLLEPALHQRSLPARIRRSLHRGLAADPANRTPDAAALLEDLQHAIQAKPLLSRRPVQVMSSLAILALGTAYFAYPGANVAAPPPAPGQIVAASQNGGVMPDLQPITELLHKGLYPAAIDQLKKVKNQDRDWAWHYLHEWATNKQPNITDTTLAKPVTPLSSLSPDGSAVIYANTQNKVWTLAEGNRQQIAEYVEAPTAIRINNQGDLALILDRSGRLSMYNQVEGQWENHPIDLPGPARQVLLHESETDITIGVELNDPVRYVVLKQQGGPSQWEAVNTIECATAIFNPQTPCPVLLIHETDRGRTMDIMDSAGQTMLSRDLPASIRPRSFTFDPSTGTAYLGCRSGEIWTCTQDLDWVKLLSLPTEHDILAVQYDPASTRIYFAAEDVFVLNSDTGRLILRLNDEDRSNYVLGLHWNAWSKNLTAITTDQLRSWSLQDASDSH